MHVHINAHTCLYMCTPTHMYVLMHVHTCLYICAAGMCTCAGVPIHICTHVQVYRHVCSHTRLYMCPGTYVCTHTPVHMCAHMYMHVCLYICAHVYLHASVYLYHTCVHTCLYVCVCMRERQYSGVFECHLLKWGVWRASWWNEELEAFSQGLLCIISLTKGTWSHNSFLGVGHGQVEMCKWRCWVTGRVCAHDEGKLGQEGIVTVEEVDLSEGMLVLCS